LNGTDPSDPVTAIFGKLLGDIRRRPLILVADDNADTRELYASAFSRFGFEVIAGIDTIQALARVPSVLPDMIITDVSTPCGDPWEEIHSIKADPRTRNIPIVVVTAHCEPGVRERSERERCAAFFTKPASRDGVATMLRQIVDLSEWLGRAPGP
jgi:CheY-like chemotaxis protein